MLFSASGPRAQGYPPSSSVNTDQDLSTGHQHQRGLLWEHRPGASTQALAAASSTDLHTALGHSMGHGHQRDLSVEDQGPRHASRHRHRCRLWMPTWPPVAAGPWTTAWSLVAAETMDIHMSLGINTVWGGSTAHRHQHVPPTVAWTTDVKMASRGNTDPGGLWRRSNPENEPSPSLASWSFSESG